MTQRRHQRFWRGAGFWRLKPLVHAIFGPYFAIVLAFRAFYDPLQRTEKFSWPESSEDLRQLFLQTLSATPA